jgi:predicted metal-dependent hydrolase
VSHKGAELVLPQNARNVGHKFNNALSQGYQFLLTKESWIRGSLQKMSVMRQNSSFSIDHSTIPFFGKMYGLKYIDSNSGSALSSLVEIKTDSSCDDYIEVRAESSCKHKDILIKFLKDELLLSIEKLACAIEQKHGLEHSKIRIMSSKRRWGSCSNKGVIAFNLNSEHSGHRNT